MHYLQAIALVAATAAASPILDTRTVEDNTTLTRRSYHAAEVLDACGAAPNCETYEGPIGTMIRFKKGMEPGSASYKASRAHTKRDDSMKTHVTFGDGSLNYGSKGASGVGGVIHTLYDACHEGSCDTTDLKYTTRVATNLAEQDATITLSPSGQYDGWDERNIFVDAMVAASSQGEKCETQKWMHGGYLSGVESGEVYQCTQTTFISINRFSGGNLQGFMTAHVEQDEEERNWCAKISGVLGGISGVVAAVPGAGPAVGVAGGFFGIISGVCS